MLWSLFIYPAFNSIPRVQHNYWLVPSDAWKTLLASHDVVWAGFSFIYEAGVGLSTKGTLVDPYGTLQFQAGPLFPILLTPVAWIQGIFPTLGESYPAWNPRPGAWLVYGPYASLIASFPFLYAIRSTVTTAAASARTAATDAVDRARETPNLVRLQIAGAVLVLVPTVIITGHFEDALAVAFLMLAARDIARQRWLRAAAMIALVFSLSLWSLLFIPLAFFMMPRKVWFKFSVLLLFPLIVYVGALASDWAAASRALFQAVTYPEFGHGALWVHATGPVSAAPIRLGALALAVFIAWRMRSRASSIELISTFAVILTVRLAFEPVMTAYYVAPALGFMLLEEFMAKGRVWRSLATGVPLIALCVIPVHGNRSFAAFAWWAAFTVISVIAVWPAGRRVFASHEADPESGAPPEAEPEPESEQEPAPAAG